MKSLFQQIYMNEKLKDNIIKRIIYILLKLNLCLYLIFFKPIQINFKNINI